MHVIFTGVEDLFEARVEVGSRLSGDNERLDEGPSDTVGLLPTFVCRDRGLKTALRSLEAFMMFPQPPNKSQLSRPGPNFDHFLQKRTLKELFLQETLLHLGTSFSDTKPPRLHVHEQAQAPFKGRARIHSTGTPNNACYHEQVPPKSKAKRTGRNPRHHSESRESTAKSDQKNLFNR